jgi:hypothetical protein
VGFQNIEEFLGTLRTETLFFNYIHFITSIFKFELTSISGIITMEVGKLGLAECLATSTCILGHMVISIRE